MQHVELVWPPCCIMLYDIEGSLISIKHLMQLRSTFLLFSCVNNKVALVWPRTSTLLHSRTRSKWSLRQGQRVVWPEIPDHYSSQISNLRNSSLLRTTCYIRLATQSSAIQQSWIQQCWMMLHSFGQGFKQVVRAKAICQGETLLSFLLRFGSSCPFLAFQSRSSSLPTANFNFFLFVKYPARIYGIIDTIVYKVLLLYG